MVEETLAPGAVVSDIARGRGLTPQPAGGVYGEQDAAVRACHCGNGVQRRRGPTPKVWTFALLLVTKRGHVSRKSCPPTRRRPESKFAIYQLTILLSSFNTYKTGTGGDE